MDTRNILAPLAKKNSLSGPRYFAFRVLPILYLLIVIALVAVTILLISPAYKQHFPLKQDSIVLSPHSTIDAIYPGTDDSDVDDLPFSMGPTEERDELLYRLAKFIEPMHYEVALNVTVRGWNGANASTVTGTSAIHFRVNGDASNVIELHAEGFSSLRLISLTTADGAEVKAVSDYYNDVKRTAVWLLDRPMRDGEILVMKVIWTPAAGVKGVYGLYETWEDLSGGGRAYQLATQGQVMGTRKWMPAFDEPALKATWSLTISHPTQLNARSNAHVESEKESAGIRTTVFSKTARISPYVYAWSLTYYPELSTIVNGVKVAVIADRRQNLTAALHRAEFAVQSYFSVLSINQSYVFEKLDFVFLPDHSSSMENVGHITTAVSRITWTVTYVHEMMHQYFGNLITLSWWDEVWINEALAIMYEIDAIHGIGTEAAIADLRRWRDQHIRQDSLRNTIALKNEVTTETEAWANFAKSYSKGSVILFMLRNLIGEVAWKDGVQAFLNKFAFQAVKGDDFLRTIREIAEKYHDDGTPEFAYYMAKDFFEMRGYPLLSIKRDGRKLELRQARFVRGFFNDSNRDNASTHFWRIPVHLVKLDGMPYKTILMSSQAVTIDIDTDEELIIDPKKIVYYRVIYDANTYKNLAKSAYQWNDVEPILTDLMHSAFSGYVDLDLAFDVIFGDFKPKGDSQMVGKMRDLLSAMFHFDTVRLARANALLGSHSTASDTLRSRSNDNPTPVNCKHIHSFEDALIKYTNNRTTLNLLFCTKVKKSMGVEAYGGLLKSFFLGDTQMFHPQDVTAYVGLLKVHFPNMIADLMVAASQHLNENFTEHDFALLLNEVRSGFDLAHTERLRQIFENSPRATRANREFITRIFDEQHAAITEAKERGDKACLFDGN